MANRVVLGALPGGGRGLRVSTPGNDVLNPSLPPNALAFDSRWGENSRIHQIATVTVSARTAPQQYDSFGFGVDFGVLPPVFAFAVNGNVLQPLAVGMNGFVAFWENYSQLEYSRMRAYTNRVEFLRFPAVTTVRYFVMRPI